MSKDGQTRPDLVKAMADALPTHAVDDTTSDLSSTLDALSLFAHAIMASRNFRLIGFNEDNNIEAEVKQLAPRLPSQWNESISSRSFVYAHDQSSMQFIIKVDRLGAKMEIRGLAVGDDRIHRVELVAKDYVSSGALPLRISKTNSGEEDRSDLEQKLKQVFPDVQLRALTQLFENNILEKLFPSSTGPQIQNRPQRPDDSNNDPLRDRRDPPPAVPHPYPANDPHAIIPRNPNLPPAGDFPPPGFEDEYEINRPPRGPVGWNPLQGGSPYNIGHDDLNPPGLGPHDPLRGSFVGGGGLPRPGGGMGGGMHPTFDDPLFAGPHRGGDDEFGAGGYADNAPPGARWDPVGPGGLPRFGGGRHGGRGGNNNNNNPFGPGGGFGGGGFGGGFA
ncbi:PI31 proteasome regulator N-terminal-domain-containing protein [Coniochaeta sp. 2T2.1]|nr:PI31 proteasome regulator N-terminal-domain-containing protein [Coniochaeta sp. 2T2.1]